MDIQFKPEDLAFRDEVRAFLKEKLTPEFKSAVVGGQITKDAIVAWQKILYEKGWIAPNWPQKYGGTGWNITQKYIFENECAEAGAPAVVPFGKKNGRPGDLQVRQ